MTCWPSGKSMTFKTTMKGLNKLGQITMGDLGVHLATFAALCVSLGIGLHKLLAGPTVITTLAISVVWIIYAMIPIWLLMWYTFLGRGTSLHMWCRCAPLLSSCPVWPDCSLLPPSCCGVCCLRRSDHRMLERHPCWGCLQIRRFKLCFTVQRCGVTHQGLL